VSLLCLHLMHFTGCCVFPSRMFRGSGYQPDIQCDSDSYVRRILGHCFLSVLNAGGSLVDCDGSVVSRVIIMA
jgi:hypothetical protein